MSKNSDIVHVILKNEKKMILDPAPDLDPGWVCIGQKMSIDVLLHNFLNWKNL